MDEMDPLEAIFDPKSVAIAGVSQGNTGQFFLDTLLQQGFRGKIYPLNPKGGEVSGLRVYANVRDIPGPVDYVISCVPARAAPQLVSDCAAKGVKAVCLYTAGFSESGSEGGRALEREVIELARTAGLRILGPNCIGVYNPRIGLAFAYDLPRESGAVALVCQSGGNAAYLVRAAAQRGVRFSKAISYGNGCDINESDLLEHFSRDPQTRLVAVYIEGAKDAQRFQKALKALSSRKPVVVLKGGRTSAGARVAASHTGALAGSDDVWDKLLEQAGAIRVASLEELVDMLVTLLYMPAPGGRRVAILGSGGAASVLAADDCLAAGLTVPALPSEVRRDLRSLISTDAGTILGNPVDLPPVSLETCSAALRRLCDYDGVDVVISQVPLHAIGY
ncbi:MAG: CoA-binding protein [Chloroflexi bacterium]|nr:CoA-binding protein [Chloroflexota bacterium]